MKVPINTIFSTKEQEYVAKVHQKDLPKIDSSTTCHLIGLIVSVVKGPKVKVSRKQGNSGKEEGGKKRMKRGWLCRVPRSHLTV